jgi:hypothetical protein
MREKLLPTQRIKAIEEELAGFLLRRSSVRKENTMWRTMNTAYNLVISMHVII